MDNAVVGAVSGAEAALTTARKYVENDLWSCPGVQISDLLLQVHRLRAQAEWLELCLVREVVERGIPTEASVRVKLAEAFGAGWPTPEPRSVLARTCW